MDAEKLELDGNKSANGGSIGGFKWYRSRCRNGDLKIVFTMEVYNSVT